MSRLRLAAAAVFVVAIVPLRALAQGLGTPGRDNTAPQASSLGPLPGAPGGLEAGADSPGGILVGRGTRRVPSTISRPVGPTTLPALNVRRLPATASRLARRPPIASALVFPELVDEDATAGGLTLDQAIEALHRDNLLVRSRQLEIPQAEADVLTAGLRANPFVYVDSQFIPYGHFDPVTNPGGPGQYDLNVTLPVDWNLKRRARVGVAQRAQRVVQAVFQNAVRLQLDELYAAYIDALAARQAVRLARAAEENMARAQAAIQDASRTRALSAVEVDQIALQVVAAQLARVDAESALRTSKRRLEAMLNFPPGTAEQMELTGTLHDRSPPPPPVDELVQMALLWRPDLAAFRLGLDRARADVGLARANRFSDVYVLYQPFTYQNNQPFGLPSSTSWTLGATASVPLWDRNQGTIRRAQLNVEQTRLEEQAQQRAIITEVQNAYEEYVTTRTAVESMETRLLPAAKKVLEDTLELYREGDVSFTAYLTAQRDYSELVRQYYEILVRHRRSMLAINTAVGQRLLP
ncbi:MAG: TolC family protein [Pirellulales bacterium]